MKDQPIIGTNWIIYSKRKNAIWKGTFKTKQEAEQELTRQMQNLTPELRTEVDWIIKAMPHRITRQEKDVADGFGAFE